MNRYNAAMRIPALVLLAACGSASVKVETRIAPLEEAPPEHVAEHQHVEPSHAADVDKIYVEITSDGDHGDLLRKSASDALGSVPYAVSVKDGGDVELHVELAQLVPTSGGATCRVKVFVMRLPQHDLLAIADGGGQATAKASPDMCVARVGAAIVRDKVPLLLQRQLAAKR